VCKINIIGGGTTMISAIEQRLILEEVLDTLGEYLRDKMIIAGGAPRNWFEDKPANDVDIYLPEGDRDDDILSPLAKNLRDIFITVKPTHTYPPLKGFNIKQVLNVKYKGVLLQFIFTSLHLKDFTGSKILGNFDVNINKVLYRNSSIVMTEDAMKDFENKTITFNHRKIPDAQLRHSLDHHLPKIISYYPEHKLVLG
jgi:hypothetical protein